MATTYSETSQFHPCRLNFKTFEPLDEDSITIDYKSNRSWKSSIIINISEPEMKYFIMTYHETKSRCEEYKENYTFTAEEMNILKSALLRFFYFREYMGDKFAAKELNAEMAEIGGHAA